MHGGKRIQGTAVVSEGAAHAVLRRGAVPALAAEEERALRMRLGASLPMTARLERIATASDAEIDLLAIEIEAFLAQRERGTAAAAPRAPAPSPSRTKEKIVRALRRRP
ncbi:MAG TPA: hypothetical protein VFP65_18160 [Anaeromyxobacteraceae bacterium]|nr:hypothetical protein [Anaeromyxobacteraceae bacterium]